MDFREAMDRVGVSAVELAEEFQRRGTDVKPQTLRQARLDPAADGYRSPPAGWREVLADLARERLPELQEVVEQLEAAE